MKLKFKARELWLFAPFLLIIAGAIYWARVEQVSRPGAGGMLVSDFKVEAAPGYWREKGYSHQVEVSVSHPWPRPKWWGQTGNISSRCDPLHPERPESLIGGTTLNQYLSPGGAITFVQDGRNIRWPDKDAILTTSGTFENDTYRFSHYIKLSEIPAKAGAITFHGLYRIVGQPQIALERAVRKAGETLPMATDKNPGAQLLAIDAKPFQVFNGATVRGKTSKEDDCRLNFRVRDLQATASQSNFGGFPVYDIELKDEKGVIISPYSTTGFSQGTSSGETSANANRAHNERVQGTVLMIDQRIKTTGRLTMSGKISLDQRWPLQFKVELPPRGGADTYVGKADDFPIPLWRDGKPIETP